MAEAAAVDQPVGPERGEEPSEERARRRRGARRTTLILVAIVLALYFGYILYAVLAGLHTRH